MPTPLTIVTFFHFLENGDQRLREFQERAAPSFARHQLRVEKEIAVVGRGQIGPSPNLLEQPDLIQIATIPSSEAFQEYLADPDVRELAPIRASGLRKMTAHLGPSLDLAGIAQPAREGATHVAALVRFRDEAGLGSLVEFNRRGVESDLFPRHGIRVLHLAKSTKSIVAMGSPDGEAPQAFVHFAIEEPARMKEYLSDPEYLALAPLRDACLESYHFFQGA